MVAKTRRRQILDWLTPGEKLDTTPVELPAGTRVLKSASAEIQEQIAIQIAIKQANEGAPKLQTIDEIQAELMDLEDDSDVLEATQYEYEDMEEAIFGEEAEDLIEGEPEGAPPEEGENNEESDNV